MTADLNLDALAALEQAATPGPWEREVGLLASLKTAADVDLLIALRNNLPALIDAARERDALIAGHQKAARFADQNFRAWENATARADAAEAERDAALARERDLRERIEGVRLDLNADSDYLVTKGSIGHRLHAALATGGDRG